MSTYVNKKMKFAMISLIIFCLSMILTICSFVSLAFVERTRDAIIPIVLSSSMLVYSGLLYLGVFFPIVRNVKWLRSKGMENIADDIDLKQSTLPKSKIHCGQKAFFCKKGKAIVPYEEVAWVYAKEDSLYGIVVQVTIIVYTADGMKFTIYSDKNEFKWLIDKYIIPHSPNLIVGYNAEKKFQYQQINPEFGKGGKRAKRVGGIILMCLGLTSIITNTINYEEGSLVPMLSFAIGLLVIGAVLCLSDRKKDIS